MGISCKLCGQECSNRFNLARHVRTIHSEASGPLTQSPHNNLAHLEEEYEVGVKPLSPASDASSMKTEASDDSIDTSEARQPNTKFDEDGTDTDDETSGAESDTSQDNGEDNSADTRQGKYDIFGRVPDGEKMETGDYPWHDLKNEIAEMYEERVQRRTQTYIAEGYTEEKALSEAYDDFREKFLLAARHLLFMEISKHAALDGDNMFNEIQDLKDEIYDNNDIKEEYAWKRAIRMKEHLLIPLLPGLEDFNEEEDDEEMANDQ